MYKHFIFALLLIPVFVYAYTSVIVHPKSSFEIIPIAEPVKSQEFFGELEDFPHTYEFVVTKKFDLRAQVAVPDAVSQESNISIIVIKEENRGVSEVGRTNNKEITWTTERDVTLAETFRIGGVILATLEPGIYRLEVSSPDNIGKYRLYLGTDKINYSYFENVRRLFEVKTLLGTPKLFVVMSPVVYWPFGAFVLILFVILFYRKKYTNKKHD